MDDYLGTAREISALLRQMEGGRVSTKAIAGYVRRGRLESAGDRVEFRANGATAKVPVYRIGAVRELVAKLDDERRERRALRKVNTPRGA
ncbi:hypothetical protein [Branchiibius hedensis]|uniref:hypothetical protein n=1 Tax=Branchiibius hedensis TaxID=672460 RepID=UPI000D6AEEB4|nr:hypothetical protein [Branchiibius hedensis]